MTHRELLWKRALNGDRDAVDELVQFAADQNDLGELRRLADYGSIDAIDVLVELAGEREDVDELRRLASLGNGDALDMLLELGADLDDAGSDAVPRALRPPTD